MRPTSRPPWRRCLKPPRASQELFGSYSRILKTFPDVHVVVVVGENVVEGKGIEVLNGKKDVGWALEEAEEGPEVGAAERGEGIRVIKAARSRRGGDGGSLEHMGFHLEETIMKGFVAEAKLGRVNEGGVIADKDTEKGRGADFGVSVG